MAEAQPIDTAPKGGAWLLGYVPARIEFDVPWMPIAWGDRGWHDHEHNECDPTLWTPLPNPQPKPTGWRPVEGTILIRESSPDGWTCNGKPCLAPWLWSVEIQRNDGSFDEYRDYRGCRTLEQAEVEALKWQARFGLPITRIPLDGKVIPFRPRVTRQ